MLLIFIFHLISFIEYFSGFNFLCFSFSNFLYCRINYIIFFFFFFSLSLSFSCFIFILWRTFLISLNFSNPFFFMF